MPLFKVSHVCTKFNRHYDTEYICSLYLLAPKQCRESVNQITNPHPDTFSNTQITSI